MPLNKGFLFDLYNKIKRHHIVLLWKSQRKKFKSIGPGSSVIDLPLVMGYNCICVGKRFFCGKDVRIEAWEKYRNEAFSPEVLIGDNVTLTDRCYISCVNHVEIGDNVLVGRDVFISDNSHGNATLNSLADVPLERPLYSKGPVIIQKNVWIGRQVTILSGVTIGENSIIGANSVVNKDIPANCLAVGSPAVVVKLI